MPKCVNPPIQKASTILLGEAAALYDADEVRYGRNGLEPQATLAQALADLEHGTATRLFPSGLAALAGSILCLLAAGDEILVVDCVYGRSRPFFEQTLSRLGIRTRYIPPCIDADALAALFTPRTRLLLLESPGSLSYEIQDVPALVATARQAGLLTLVDNSWGAGLLFKPLDHGADISIQSLTKYVGGHSDCFMGAATLRDPALIQRYDRAYKDTGWSVSPDDCYQMLRGLKTLEIRLASHAAGAAHVAGWLGEHSAVRRILCPFLPGDPGHSIWKRDFSGHNGLLSFVLDPGRDRAAFACLNALRIFGLGFSWGGVESLAIHCNPQMRARSSAFVPDGPMIRLQIGLEDPQALIADLAQALNVYSNCGY